MLLDSPSKLGVARRISLKNRMRKIKLIGLTGGIATGKTTVAKMFAKLGVPVIDTDRLSHEVLKKRHPAAARIFKLCGTLDRPKIAELIFNSRNSALKKDVEKVVHSEVWKMALKKLKGFERRGHHVAIIDVPLLFETGWDKKVDRSVTVFCSRAEQIKRCPAKFRQRLNFQMSIKEKAQLADFVVDNSGGRAETAEQVRSLVRLFDK